MEAPSCEPLPSARAYGECAFWLALVGMALATIGGIIAVAGTAQTPDAERLLRELLAGAEPAAVWERTRAVAGSVSTGTRLPPDAGNALAMVGVRICALAGVAGVWVAAAAMLIHDNRPRLFPVLGVLLALLLTLSAAGLFTLA